MGEIRDLLALGDVDSLTRLVLTDAIYFKGKWASQFKKGGMRFLPFYVTPGILSRWACGTPSRMRRISPE